MFRAIILLLCALLLPLHAALPQGTDLSRLNEGNPEQSYRERSFAAYKPLEEVSRTLKVGHYSSYENPTGIFFRKGEHISLTLRNQPSGTIQLIIRDFREGDTRDAYPLKVGKNDIVVKHDGLGYIDYRSSQGCAAPQVAIELEGGIVNGIFSRHDGAATWRRLLAGLPAGMLDMMGERCQVIFDAEGLRKGVPEDGSQMLALYDRIVELEQSLMGWDQEGIHPGNHITCRTVWQGYMHADDEGAAFHNGLTASLSHPEGLIQGVWGVAHELGHINQLRPEFNWAGMTEVSNNIFSAWCNYVLYQKDLRLEHEVAPTPEGFNLRGGRFDSYINNALVKRQLWQFQGGPDSGIGRVPGRRTGDHFVSVCPLWQLLLYCQVVQGREDFYPAIFRAMRAVADEDIPHGQMRLNFCRYASESAGLNLGEFLLRTGMLGVMNRCVEDYVPHQMTITRDMVVGLLSELSRLPEPDSPVIYYINANNADIYRHRLPVEPAVDFCPELPRKGGAIVFPAEQWKNAVAFEVYQDRSLVRICLRGLGQQDNASTTVICPPGATAIYAVQWDGKRLPVTAGSPSLAGLAR